MRLRHIEIHPYLKGYVSKIWLFDDDDAPDQEVSVMVFYPEGHNCRFGHGGWELCW